MKYKLLNCLLILISVMVYQMNTVAQVPDTLWTKIHSISPGGDIDEPKSIRQASDGGFIITGSFVPDGLNSFVDVLLLKTNPSGDISWIKSFDRGFIEEGYSVEQTSDGGYIIAGRTVTGSYPIIEPLISDGWIIKTNNSRDTLWTKIYGSPGNDYFTSIQQTSDSGYILAGTMYSEYSYAMYEINEEYEPDSSKAWLVRTNQVGDTLWTKTYFEKSYANCSVQTEDGGYIIVGWVFPQEQPDQSDVLIIKTDSQGDTLWTKITGGEENDIGYCVRETDDGYIISGQTKPAGEPYNALAIKINKSGDVIWSKIFGGENSDAAFTVEVDGSEYFFAGATNGTWWISALGDMWVFKTNTEGDLLWEQIYDIATNDIAWCGITTDDSGYALTGLAGYGFGGDLWMAKLTSQPSGIRNGKTTPDNFLLYQNYPNPFNPITTIEYSIAIRSIVTVKIYDVLGNEIVTLLSEEKPAGEYEVQFEADGLPGGIYFYQVKAGDNKQTRKMVLIK